MSTRCTPRFILILDEATAAIDSETEALIQDALRTLLSDRTAIVIAHRLSTIRHADQILVLHHGRVCERGRHDELLAAGGIYARLYRLQFELAQQAGGEGEANGYVPRAPPIGGGRRAPSRLTTGSAGTEPVR